MSQELPIYVRGAIAMDNGDLIQVTNVKVAQKRTNKILHTLKRQASGIVLGNEETTVTFDYVIDETGAERDYMSLVRTGKIKKLRFKVPGETFSVIGACGERTIEMPTDDAVKGSVEWMGKTEI
jgi:hypothetical protein